MRSSSDLRGPPGCRAAVIMLIALSAMLPGCGRPGPKRYRVHGTVTHRGQPVPVGRIVFEPDIAQGNRGPQGFAAIENGRFDTAATFNQGGVGGPTIVKIDGSEMIPGEDDAMTAGRQLFPTYETRIELPQHSASRDFDVPGR